MVTRLVTDERDPVARPSCELGSVLRSVADATVMAREQCATAPAQHGSAGRPTAMAPSSRAGVGEGRWRGRTGQGTSVPLSAVRGRARRGRWAGTRSRSLALAASFVVALAACAPAPSFDPTGPCDVDGRIAGAYPVLEAALPGSLDAEAPDSLDSGRSCTPAALGALVSHEVTELRFAGATWDRGGGHGATIAILGLPSAALPAAWVEEFYETGARTARKTEKIETSRPSLPDVGPAFRLDTLNELSFQSVVVWADGPFVRVVLVASPVEADASRVDHDAVIAAAVAAGVAAADPASDPAPSAAGATDRAISSPPP